MTAKILDGKRLAASIRDTLAAKVAALPPGAVPGLAVLCVGDDPASHVYVRQKHTMCDVIGIYSSIEHMPSSTTQAELLQRIDSLNNDPRIHGILVQLPLPAHINPGEILEEIAPHKDVDGFHSFNVGRLWLGKKAIYPCTPAGIMVMLESTGVDFDGKKAVIVGRSSIVGKPVAAMLLDRNCTVTLCHSRTRDLASITRTADILVVAVGKPGYITGEMIKSGAIVIDVGINRGPDGKLSGDVDFHSAAQLASWITPVPGGVGPMTIVMLMQNTLQLAGIR